MIINKGIVPALCCIHIGHQESGVKFSTMTYAQYKKYGTETGMKIIADRSLNNVKTIHTIIKTCANNKWNYRIGSNVFPLMTHPDLKIKLEDFYNYSDIMAEFSACANTIRKTGIRCSMHPDQYVVPASPRPEVAKNAIVDLEQHAFIMDLLQLPQSYEAPINIHMNCYNDGAFDETSTRLIDRIKTMSWSVTSRLVFECEDKKNSWNTRLLYDYLYKKSGIPITYDSHHHRVGNTSGELSPTEACELARTTWGSFKPMFHFSNGKTSPSDRAHSDYVYEIHKELFSSPTDIDFEFKQKEQSINKFISDFSQPS
jgi:UV DNA damage endonuclease